MGSIKKLASQTAVYGLSTIVGRFLNVMLVPLYTRVFNEAEFGVNVTLYAYISFFNILLTHGMETAFFRFAEKNDYKKAYSTSFISVLGVSLVFGLLMLFFGNYISYALGYSSQKIFIWLSAGILIADALCAIPFALLRHLNKPFRFALIKNLNIGINIFINVYILLLAPYIKNTYQIQLPFFNPNPGVQYIFIANLIASLATLFLLIPELIKLTLKFDTEFWKTMIKYAVPMAVVGFAGMINETLDRIMLGFYSPDTVTANTVTGIYGAVYKLSIIISVFIQAFKFAAEPFFFSHAKQSDKRDIYATVMNYFVIVCLTIFLVVMLYLNYIKYFLGEKFHSGLHVVPILLMANICLGIYYNLSVWYKLSDNTLKGAQISIVGAAITIVANAILIPKLSYTGCAIATLICYFSMMVISFIWGNKYYPIPYNVTKIISYFGFAIAAYAVFVFLVEPNIYSYYIKNTIAFLLIASFAVYAFIKEKALNLIK
ncbi:MAG: oligosaccharide flippase family protein [Bacteroidia bacterium]